MIDKHFFGFWLLIWSVIGLWPEMFTLIFITDTNFQFNHHFATKSLKLKKKPKTKNKNHPLLWISIKVILVKDQVSQAQRRDKKKERTTKIKIKIKIKKNLNTLKWKYQHLFSFLISGFVFAPRSSPEYKYFIQFHIRFISIRDKTREPKWSKRSNHLIRFYLLALRWVCAHSQYYKIAVFVLIQIESEKCGRFVPWEWIFNLRKIQNVRVFFSLSRFLQSSMVSLSLSHKPHNDEIHNNNH